MPAPHSPAPGGTVALGGRTVARVGFGVMQLERRVIAIAAQLGVTPAQVGLAWLLNGYSETLLIPGPADRAHLMQNVAAGDITLGSAALEVLDRVGAEQRISM
jgi:aryl-alcohol dehydrogenase-like predicted oxidoreductase